MTNLSYAGCGGYLWILNNKICEVNRAFKYESLCKYVCVTLLTLISNYLLLVRGNSIFVNSNELLTFHASSI